MEDIFRGLPHPTHPSFAQLVEFSEENADEIKRHLPCFTALIATEVSFWDAYKISYYLSGKRLYLPKSKKSFSVKLQCSIDTETYQLIQDIACGGPHIEIPSSWGVFNVIRKVAILTYLEETKSKADAQVVFGSNRRFIDKLWNTQKLVGNTYPFLATSQSSTKNTKGANQSNDVKA